MLLQLLLLTTLVYSTDVNVMLPLDIVTSSGLNDKSQIASDFAKLKSAGVSGVMCDVWWGLVETSPKEYDFSSYLELVQLAEDAGLKFQAVMSFHKCGGNVGDTCDIPIPQWVRDAGSNYDAFFKDPEGNVNNEYISFSADSLPLFEGRTPIELYTDYMKAFKNEFSSFLNSGEINEIQVGMGPCGETRYPSYPLSRWTYCGVGEFQCSDKNALLSLYSAAAAAGHSDWGYASPSNAGTYNSKPPSSTGFFGSGSNNYKSEYGQFFLDYYNGVLLTHAQNILSEARSVFGSKMPLAAKVSGIHWWYDDYSHAAELTAGYYNTNGRDAYADIAKAFKKSSARFDFTCLEMSGTDSGCKSDPTSLIDQAFKGADSSDLEKCGENAIELCGYGGCNTSGFNQIVKQAKWYGLTSFTYLRMTRALVDDSTAYGQFCDFVKNMQ
ncbi:Beta-amylase [Entamoeba marina]